MSFWKKWWKKKNKDKKGADEYEDSPLPTETIFADNDLEKRIRARRNNLSVSRSGRYKAKSKERLQLSDELYKMAAAGAMEDCNKNQSQDGYSHGADETADINGHNTKSQQSVQQQQQVH